MDNNFSVPSLVLLMPTYNHEKFIVQAIESVLLQTTSFDVFLFISDDSSTDSTYEIALLFPEKNRVKIFVSRNVENIGPFLNGAKLRNEAFNFGCKYVAILEGDDYWTDPLKLQKQVDFLEANPDYVLSFHEVEKIDSSGKCLNELVLGKERWKDLSQEQLISGDLVPSVSVVFRREYMKDFLNAQEPVKNADTFLFALLGQYGKAHFHSDIHPAKYRIHQNGIWSGINEIQKTEAVIHTFETLRKYIKPEFVRIVNKSLFEKYIVQFTRLPYSSIQRIMLYLRFVFFSVSNELLLDFIKVHWFVFKSKLKIGR